MKITDSHEIRGQVIYSLEIDHIKCTVQFFQNDNGRTKVMYGSKITYELL